MQNNGGGVLFWGCITADGPAYGSTVLEGSINSDTCIEILESSLLDTLHYYDKDTKDICFQPDNASAHTSGPTKAWFTRNGFSTSDILNWPAQNPDLNPIEHAWSELKRHLDAYSYRPQSKEELEERINIEWNKSTKEDCLEYIDSMSQRIEAVIKSKGGPTKY